MGATNYFGIYPEIIDSEYEKCEELLCEFGDVLNAFDVPNTLSYDAYLLNEAVTDRLQNYLNPQDMTNSIVAACYDTVIDCVEAVDDRLVKALGLSLDRYVNGNDSHLYISVGDKTFEYPNNSIEDIIKDAVIEKEIGYCQFYEADDYLMGDIAAFWKHDATIEEIADYYTDRIIPEELVSLIDANAKVHDMKDSLPKELIERFDSSPIFIENLTHEIYDKLPEYCENKCLTANTLYKENGLYLEALKDVMNHDAEISSEVQKGVKDKYCVKNGKIQETKKSMDLEK